MSYEKQISEAKQSIMNMLVNSPNIVAAIDNDSIKSPDDLIYDNLWYSFRIPDTEVEKKTYICIKINVSSDSSENNMVNIMDIYFLIVTHQDLMRVPRDSIAYGCTRIDYIAGQIEGILNNSIGIGFGKIRLLSSVEDAVDATHPCRILRFRGSISNKQCI